MTRFPKDSVPCPALPAFVLILLAAALAGLPDASTAADPPQDKTPPAAKDAPEG